MDEAVHKGHRERLRERFLRAGGEALADYELLEMVLFAAHPRGDTKVLAKRLVAHFGGFVEAITAPPARLREVDGIGGSAVAALKVVEHAAVRLAQRRVMNRHVIGSWSDLMDYCYAVMAHDPTEQFRILFLDRKNHLIADELQQRGTVDHTPVYPREVARRSLELHASAIVMVHNHPSGDATPSRADVDMTKAVRAALAAVGIELHDHIVIGKSSHTTFKSLGLL